MKLLLDQNLSHRLLSSLSEDFPGSTHVRLVGLERAMDDDIWRHAVENLFAIVTQDADFAEMSLLRGHPPKVLWVATGNTGTDFLRSLFARNRESMRLFSEDETAGCLQLF